MRSESRQFASDRGAVPTGPPADFGIGETGRLLVKDAASV